MMVERIFLGWHEPFLGLAADRLLSDRDALPSTLVLVPTSQAGRRLREAMAEKAGALLSPKMVTPGSLLRTPDPLVAAEWIEQLAWLEVLEEITDWSSFAALLPEPPEEDGSWAEAMAVEFVALRRSLQESGLTLESAAAILGQSIEAERWACLKRLEKIMESKLRQWGYESRSRVLARGVNLPAEINRIVLAGLAEMPPILRKTLQQSTRPIVALVGAPCEESDLFCEFGTPLVNWSEKISTLPKGDQGSVLLVADSKQQATEAVRLVAEARTESPDLAIGCGDPGDGEELARTFSENGWSAFHPGARSINTGIARWLAIWAQWLAKPDLKIIADLLALPETETLVGTQRAELSRDLAKLRHDFMITGSDDLRRLIRQKSPLRDHEKQTAKRLLPVLEIFEKHRDDFKGNDADKIVGSLLSLIAQREEVPGPEFVAMQEFIDRAAPLMRRMKRRPDFWVSLMISQIPSPTPKPPEDRAIDIQGWLELFYEPGKHLVLCGMNEGRVPAAVSNDPWLGENARQWLGLITANQRAARDAFLFNSMIEARLNSGRVDIICAKSGSRGEALLPSRLLLNTTPEELPQRVKTLFKEIQPPESSLAWQRDWSWQTPHYSPKNRIRASTLRDYISCPFRYYLKHICDMSAMEPDRKEWNAREFGTIPHQVLEDFGRDAFARESTDPEFISDWFSSRLDEVVALRHGKSPVLAIRIQTEALRQRLKWTASIQAEQREMGWKIIDVEFPVKIPFGDLMISAQIDRIDRHEKTGALRVVDYKTGKVDSVKQAHIKKENTRNERPAHLAADECPIFFTLPGKKQPERYRWADLQLPLYSQAVMQSHQTLSYPAYFHIGAIEKDVCISEWTDFTQEDLDSAMTSARWIVNQIQAGVFWPPAEKTAYDDFEVLTCGKPLIDVCAKV